MREELLAEGVPEPVATAHARAALRRAAQCHHPAGPAELALPRSASADKPPRTGWSPKARRQLAKDHQILTERAAASQKATQAELEKIADAKARLPTSSR